MSSSMASKSPLTDAQIRDLIKQAQNGDAEAKEKVILEHLDLARRFSARYIRYGVPLEDLYQEACYGLLLALNHYDPNHEASFATFSRPWMKKYICQNALSNQNSNIPLCCNQDFYLEIKKYNNAVERYREANGRAPTDDEIAKILNISLWRIRRIKQAAQNFMWPSIDIDNINETAWQDATRRPLEEEFIDSLGLSIYNGILTKREIEVLERRLGYRNGGIPETYPEISAKMGLGFETIRLTFRMAISKLQNTMKESDPP